MADDRWKKLEVWRLADELAVEVYRLTRDFPREEMYGLTSQLRRAALSVPTNVVEGYSRRGDKELVQFLNIGYGSLAEAKYLLHFARRLGYLDENTYGDVAHRYDALGRKFWAFYNSVKTSAQQANRRTEQPASRLADEPTSRPADQPTS